VTSRRPSEWVLLTYRLPREPSAPRIALWRRLKRLGVLQLSDGLVALPSDARTCEQLEWAAQQVEESGGTATVWLARPTTTDQGAALMDSMLTARAQEYLDLATSALEATALGPEERGRALRRMRHTFREIARRDFAAPPERGAAQRALDDLALLSIPAGLGATAGRPR
jgi:hypothetical protein